MFSKDDEGCIPADEMKFVLKHLPGKVCGIVYYRNTEYRNTERMVQRKLPGKVEFRCKSMLVSVSDNVQASCSQSSNENLAVTNDEVVFKVF